MGSLCGKDTAIEDEVVDTSYDPPNLKVVVTGVPKESNRFIHLPKHERQKMERVQAFFENGNEWPECNSMKSIPED